MKMTAKSFGVRVLALASLGLGAMRAHAADEEGFADAWVRPGETVVLVGDAITEQAYRNDWGFYHALTNAVPGINFVPLGYSGFRVKDWRDLERASVTNAAVWTSYRDPGWNLKTVFDGKVDAVVVLLGISDLMEPSIRDDAADIAVWLADYASLARNLRARMHPRALVFATIAPPAADPAAPQNRVCARLNNRLRMLAALTGARIADCGPVIETARLALGSVAPDYRFSPDFDHPDALGHLLIAEELCRVLGLDAAATAIAEQREAREAEIVETSAPLTADIALDRSCRPSDAEFVYNLSFNVPSDTRILPEVRVALPPGWTVDEKLLIGEMGTFRLRGAPSGLATRVVVEAAVPLWDESSDGPTGSETLRTAVDIPAPWRLREGAGEWKVYVARRGYTGGAAPGSIDPAQLYFGGKTNTLTACRRVWSEKARDVRAVLARPTSSATLDLALAVNGASVWKECLGRSGRNRAERNIRLAAGWNTLEIVCTNRGGLRPFAFDLLPLDGDDLEKLRYDIK